MKWPQHRSPPHSLRSTAPYNFVPLPERVYVAPESPFAAHDRLDPGRNHGWIDLELTTATETYTRCAYPPDADPSGSASAMACNAKQAFYHHGGQSLRPVLPGSSLRGMVRNLVEILSYGRLTRRAEKGSAARIRDERLFYRAVADQNTKDGAAYNRRFLEFKGNSKIRFPHSALRAGYLERGADGWQIRPAQAFPASEPCSFVRVGRHRLASAGITGADINCGNLTPPARTIYVQPANARPHPRGPFQVFYAATQTVSATPGPGLEEAKLVPSGDGIGANRHMHTAVYAKDSTAAPVRIPDGLWARFREDNDLQRGLPCRVVENVDEPLFYFEEKGVVTALGATLFFRVPHDHYTADFVPPGTTAAAGDATGRDALRGLDLAEAIFGTVNDGDRARPDAVSGAHRGRVQFDDATFVAVEGGGSPLLAPGDAARRWPGILSTPKPTSYQHYLVQPITDYAAVESEAAGPHRTRALQKRLLGYSATPSNQTVIRGFKRYWHRGSPVGAELLAQPPEEQATQHTCIRPIRSGCVFRGRIRFENLTDLELGALLAAVDLPGSCRHQMGMGKPLGLGSTRVRPTVLLYSPADRYLSMTGLGWFDPAAQDKQLSTCREAFRREMVDHYRDLDPSAALPKDARLDQVPRLAALYHMLEWDNRPNRHATGYGTIKPQNEFKNRHVLPTPAALRGQSDPEVGAVIPPGPEAPAFDPPPPELKTTPTTPPGTTTTRTGRIRRFQHSGIRLRLDGEDQSRTAPVNLDIFPLDSWGALNGNTVRRDTPIQVTLDRDTIVRVERQ